MVKIITEKVDIDIKEDNVTLRGTIYYSPKTPPKSPFLVNLPGFMNHRKNYIVKYFSEEFAKSGYYVLSYDYRGHGETKIDPDSRWDRTIPLIFSDIHIVLDWIIQTQATRLLKNRIALFGRSLGGAIVLSNGFIDERAKLLIALSTRYDYHTLKGQYQTNRDQMGEEIIKKMSPKYFIKKTPQNNKRILIAHCKDDDRVRFENLIQIKNHLGLRDENVIEFKSGGHSFSGHREEIFNYCSKFLEKLFTF